MRITSYLCSMAASTASHPLATHRVECPLRRSIDFTSAAFAPWSAARAHTCVAVCARGCLSAHAHMRRRGLAGTHRAPSPAKACPRAHII
jgi:hypothetical protein